MQLNDFPPSYLVSAWFKKWRQLGAIVIGCVVSMVVPVWAHAQSHEAPAPAAQSLRWISLGVGSQHLSNASQYNQSNPGLGLEWPVQVKGWPDTRGAIGFFKNSENARSVYVGGLVFPWHYREGQVKLGALVGVIDGYKRANNGGFFPLLVPTVAFESGRWGANVFLVPPVAGIPATLALQLKMGL